MKKVVVFAGHDDDTWEKTGGKGVKTDLEKDGVYEEYDTNIIIVRGTVERLRKVKGLTVLFPQENGRNMTLAERVNYANANKVDLLVDIHSNASSSRTATGAAAFYWYSSKDGKKLADYYASLLKQQGLPAWQGGTYASNLKDGWSAFYMLRYSNMPAILTENFFFTTRQELQDYLLNPAVQTKLMNIHAEMVTQYFGLAFEAGKAVAEDTTQVSKPAAPAKPAAPKPKAKAKDYFLNGDKGAGVGTIQTNLNAAGASPKLAVDNIFGSATGNAVKAFQKAHGLVVDGIYGAATKAKMKQVLAKPKKEYVQLPASVKEWRTYKLTVPPQKKYSDWSLTPARYGGLEYEILRRPYANVVTIKTSKGKRNIYVGSDTDAKIIKK